MPSEPSKRELELAARVNELDDAAMRTPVGGSGLLAAAVNFLMGRVTRGIMTAALTIFVAYHGWTALNSAQQLVADLQTKQAEVGQAQAEANALNSKAGDATVARATLEAELKKTQEQAAAARADADAQNAIINGASVRLVTLRAELEKTQAEAQQAKADADAQTQIIDGMTMAVAQEKADVAALEAEARKEMTNVRILMFTPSAEDHSLSGVLRRSGTPNGYEGNQ